MTEPATKKVSPLWKRLPLLALAAAGLWLWQGGAGVVAVEHTLVWKLPGSYATVRKVEVQLWDGSQLLTRAELETPNGLGADPERKLTLGRGSYRSETLVWREGAAQPEISHATVEVSEAPVVLIR